MRTERHLSHAQGYLTLGMLAEAAAELDCISTPDRDSLVVAGLRMAVLQEQAAWPELARLAAAVVKRTPEDAGVWITWAYATRRAISLSEAEKILLAAEVQHPAEAMIQFNLGCYACQQGNLTAARRRVDHAITLDAKFKEAAASDPDLDPLRRKSAAERD